MSTIQDLIDYVRETPENTNPAVIRTIAQNLEGGSDDALLVTFTPSEEEDWETAEWECDWTFEDLYQELTKNWEESLALAVNVKVIETAGALITRALPVVTDPTSTEPDDQHIELWCNAGTYDAEENRYFLNRFKLEPDDTITYTENALVEQSR